MNSCNHALHLLNKFPRNKLFLETSELNCRFEVNDLVITTNYDGNSSVQCKPDAVATSTIAANDVHLLPKKNFQMHQLFTTLEFKKRGAELSKPLDGYTKKRRCVYETDDKQLSKLYPIDDDSPSITAINTGEPPRKRARTDMSEKTGTLSATRSGPSKASRSGPQSKATGSRQGTKSKDETMHHAANNSQNMIDARTQCAVYGMEMLSYAPGIHRAITLLIIA